MKRTILFVEDDPDMRLTTKVLLTRAGYRVVDVDAAEEALTLVFKDPPDLVVADIRLPGISGRKFCEILRSDPRTRAVPLLLLTSLLKTQDKVSGLKTGADDYVTKPFEPSELLARVEALLRRAASAPVSSVFLRWKGVCVDLEARRAEVDGAPIPLRRKEFDLLALFVKTPKTLLTNETLSKILSEEDVPLSDNALALHVKTLRDRLGPYGASIRDQVGGYSLDELSA